MVKYLLDTNIVSYLAKNAYPSLRVRYRKVLRSEMAISSVSEGELRYGLARLPKEAHLHTLMNEFLETVDVLPWDSACAQVYGQLRRQLEVAREAMSFADTMLAAHALALNITFVTHDKAFSRVSKLKLQDWTKGPQRA